MKKAIVIYTNIVRQLLNQFGGYEIRNQGDSFTLAFRFPLDAIDWALALQMHILKPNTILNRKDYDIKYKNKFLNCIEKCGRVWISYFSLKKNYDWPKGLFALADGKIETDKFNTMAFRGLRPRIGIDIGNVIKSTGNFSGVFFQPDYHGKAVNVAANLEVCFI